jgi:hypothetical protein
MAKLQRGSVPLKSSTVNVQDFAVVGYFENENSPLTDFAVRPKTLLGVSVGEGPQFPARFTGKGQSKARGAPAL